MPALAGISCRTTPGAPCAGILMLGPVTPERLADALIEVPDPAVPIADFAGNQGLRCDFASERLDPPAIEPYALELVGAERGIVLGKKGGL